MSVRSMTGFGQAEASGPQGRFRVEMRSVNHRYLELNLNLPAGLGAHEQELRNSAAARLKRGRVDVWVQWERPSEGRYEVRVDHELMSQLAEALGQARASIGLGGDVDLALLTRYAETVAIRERSLEFDAAALEQLLAVYARALDALDQMREVEGRAMREAIEERLRTLEQAVASAERAAAELPARAGARLRERLAELIKEPAVDEQRLHQELALLADKLDVTEEVVRLRAHIAQLRDILGAGGEVGKRVDFLLQELGREANTLGSKARGLEVTEPLVAMKAEIEKIREQARNLE